MHKAYFDLKNKTVHTDSDENTSAAKLDSSSIVMASESDATHSRRHNIATVNRNKNRETIVSAPTITKPYGQL